MRRITPRHAFNQPQTKTNPKNTHAKTKIKLLNNVHNNASTAKLSLFFFVKSQGRKFNKGHNNPAAEWYCVMLLHAGRQVLEQRLLLGAEVLRPAIAGAELAAPYAEVVLLVLVALREDGAHADPDEPEEQEVRGDAVGDRTADGVLEVLVVRVRTSRNGQLASGGLQSATEHN